MNYYFYLVHNTSMRKSTKIILIIFLITLVGSVVSFSFLFSAISLTNSGLEINMTTMSWISFAIVTLCSIFGTILYIRFLRSTRFNTMLFFATVPLTIAFATLTYFVATINNYKSDAVGFIRTTLNVSTDNINIIWNYLSIDNIKICLVFFIYVFDTNQVFC